MDDIEIKERAQDEYNRICDILIDVGVSNKRRELLEPIIVNTAWMKAKLDDSREAIKNSQIVISYDNGGGQKGIRENPLFKGYESLWKSYITGMGKILESVPDDTELLSEVEEEAPKTILQIVRNKHREEA